jgi:hypothetical protein
MSLIFKWLKVLFISFSIHPLLAIENKDQLTEVPLNKPIILKSPNSKNAFNAIFPNINISEKRIVNIGQPGTNGKEAHYWLDPYTVTLDFNAGKIFCYIPVTTHGTEIDTSKAYCDISVLKEQFKYTGLKAAAVFHKLRKLKNLKPEVTKQDDFQSISLDLGPITLKGSRNNPEDANPLFAIFPTKDFVVEEKHRKSGILGNH